MRASSKPVDVGGFDRSGSLKGLAHLLEELGVGHEEAAFEFLQECSSHACLPCPAEPSIGGGSSFRGIRPSSGRS